MNETQVTRLAGMISWLAENPQYEDMICDGEIASAKDIISLMAALEENRYYEFLIVLLTKNSMDRNIGRAIHRYLAKKVEADLQRRGIADEIEEIRQLIWEGLS